MDSRLVRLVGRAEQRIEAVGQAAEIAAAVEHGLQNQLGAGSRAADRPVAFRHAVAESGTRDMGAVTIRIVFAPGPAERVELLDAPLESRVRVRGRSLVETGIGDRDDLARAIAAIARRRRGNAKNSPRDVVEQLAGKDLLDAAYLVERRHVGKTAHLQRHTHLGRARNDVVELHMRRFRDLLCGGFHADIAVEHDVDGHAGAVERRRLRRKRARRSDASGLGVQVAQCRRDLHDARVEVCPCHERQFAHLVEPGRRKVTDDGAARDGFQDLGAGLGELLSALGVERLVGLHDDVVGFLRIRMIQRQRRAFRVRGRRIDCDAVDRDLRHGRSTFPD
nr:hypothetical protein [Bradyrhizobium liaoningense]